MSTMKNFLIFWKITNIRTSFEIKEATITFSTTLKVCKARQDIGIIFGILPITQLIGLPTICLKENKWPIEDKNIANSGLFANDQQQKY